MFRPRLIPVLTMRNNGLVKSRKFGGHRYIGDPLNAVRILSDLKADELILLDISASAEGRVIGTDLLRAIAEEADVPFGVGGGIRTTAHIREIIAAGAEKVVIGTAAALTPELIRAASGEFGASAVSVCIDVRKGASGEECVWVEGGRRAVPLPPLEAAQLMQDKGAGELIIQSIDRDGTMAGYDIDLVRRVSAATTIPVVALGGAGCAAHFREGYLRGMASAVAAGSRFVYYGPINGVLVNYPPDPAAVFL